MSGVLTLAEIVGSMIAGAILEVVGRVAAGTWRAARWVWRKLAGLAK